MRSRPSSGSASTRCPARSAYAPVSGRRNSTSARGIAERERQRGADVLGLGAAVADVVEEGAQHAHALVAGAREPAVDGVLQAAAQRPERERGGERAGRRRQRGVAGQPPREQRDHRVRAGQQRGQEAVDERAVDEAVDRVQPVPRHGDRHRDRQPDVWDQQHRHVRVGHLADHLLPQRHAAEPQRQHDEPVRQPQDLAPLIRAARTEARHERRDAADQRQHQPAPADPEHRLEEVDVDPERARDGEVAALERGRQRRRAAAPRRSPRPPARPPAASGATGAGRRDSSTRARSARRTAPPTTGRRRAPTRRDRSPDRRRARLATASAAITTATDRAPPSMIQATAVAGLRRIRNNPTHAGAPTASTSETATIASPLFAATATPTAANAANAIREAIGRSARDTLRSSRIRAPATTVLALRRTIPRSLGGGESRNALAHASRAVHAGHRRGRGRAGRGTGWGQAQPARAVHRRELLLRDGRPVRERRHGQRQRRADRRPRATGLDPTQGLLPRRRPRRAAASGSTTSRASGRPSIWLTPSFKNKAVQAQDGSAGYHGYWITDFTQIDPHLGTNEELRALVDAAHARGMKVFFDIITNHTADVIGYLEAGRAARTSARTDALQATRAAARSTTATTPAPAASRRSSRDRVVPVHADPARPARRARCPPGSTT